MKRRILVVEDDDLARRAVADSLHTMAGWDVAEAYCGAQAIESARQDQPDAILLDVMMPAMDGPAMLDKLRSARVTSHIPIVLLTANVEAASNGAFAHLPVAGILLKPFDPLRLASQVANALGWDDLGLDEHGLSDHGLSDQGLSDQGLTEQGTPPAERL